MPVVVIPVKSLLHILSDTLYLELEQSGRTKLLPLPITVILSDCLSDCLSVLIPDCTSDLTVY